VASRIGVRVAGVEVGAEVSLREFRRGHALLSLKQS
jgi:hypothetical protein